MEQAFTATSTIPQFFEWLCKRPLSASHLAEFAARPLTMAQSHIVPKNVLRRAYSPTAFSIIETAQEGSEWSSLEWLKKPPEMPAWVSEVESVSEVSGRLFGPGTPGNVTEADVAKAAGINREVDKATRRAGEGPRRLVL